MWTFVDTALGSAVVVYGAYSEWTYPQLFRRYVGSTVIWQRPADCFSDVHLHNYYNKINKVFIVTKK